MGAYPLLLDLGGRRAVVIGGGAVALRRTRGLLAAGASVAVIAPAVLPELAELSEVAVSLRGYADGDLDGAWVVHACTDDPTVNAAVGGRGRAPADPVRARRRRGRGLGPDPGRDPRRRPRRRGRLGRRSGPARASAVRDAVALLLETGELPLRAARPAAGSVALVGGGPGDPELITVRGRRLLAEADVVVVDRLAPRVLLDRLDPSVEVVDVGKVPHGAGPTQQQISALLVDRARAGQAGGPAQGRRPVRARPRRRGGGRLRPGRRAGRRSCPG